MKRFLRLGIIIILAPLLFVPIVSFLILDALINWLFKHE